MKTIIINGSPRKNGNTATLLKKVLEGSETNGFGTELINLYDIDYKSCISCFSCKLLNGSSYGKCAIKDELTPILERILEADVLILGSPIYFASFTGKMRSFIERLGFPYLIYNENYDSLFPKKLKTAVIATMNVDTQTMQNLNYDFDAKQAQRYFSKLFNENAELLFSNDTYQFDDYSKYVSTRFKEEDKAHVRDTVFPVDCQKAYELGLKLTNKE